MILDRVTITGADNSINPDELEKISKQYPFVEWGILFSESREGGSRFPTIDWVEKLVERDRVMDMRLSAHICGRWVRTLLQDGRWEWIDRFLSKTVYFRRVQLNFHSSLHKVQSLEFLRALRREPGFQYIFQMDGTNDDVLGLVRQARIDAVGLFDSSGGLGVVPQSWPDPISEPIQVEGGHGDTDTIKAPLYSGYAGGIGPDNIVEQIENIRKVVDFAFPPHYAIESRVWIDMETKVRSEDDKKFDLDKVVKCLDLAQPFINQKALNHRLKVTGA